MSSRSAAAAAAAAAELLARAAGPARPASAAVDIAGDQLSRSPSPRERRRPWILRGRPRRQRPGRDGTGAFFGAGDTGTGFLGGGAAALAALGRSAGRRGLRLVGNGPGAGFLALADFGAGRLAAISRSSKACALRRTRDYTGRLPPVNGAERASFVRVFSSTGSGTGRGSGKDDRCARARQPCLPPLGDDRRIDSAANVKARGQSHEARARWRRRGGRRSRW